MMKRLPPARPASRTAARRGVTLTEVLMSMLIMSVGVSFVAAVFPLSVLRSIQGAQMTSATIHRYQAEAMIDMFPHMIHNPDGIPEAGLSAPRPNTFREHFGTNYLVDPWGYHVHLQDGTVFGAGNTPLGSPVEPFLGWFGVDRNQRAAIRRFDGGILAATNTVPGGVTAAQWAEYREQLAATLSASGDRWNEFLNTDQFSVTTQMVNGASRVIGITFGNGVDLNGLDDPGGAPTATLIPDPEVARITIHHGNGRQSQAFPITSVSGQTVLWTEAAPNGPGDLNGDATIDARPLPLSFSDGSGGWDISHVVIEISQRRMFSWIMSVRKRGDGNAGVDVAVVFNRQVDPDNEFAYHATFIPRTNIVAIEYDSATEPEPFLKKGGYVFDAQNCRWYRIQDFHERPTFGSWDYGTYEYVVFTEDRILEPGGEDTYVDSTNTPTFNQTIDDETGSGTDANGNGILDNEDINANGTLDYGRAVFLPGVIQVYPLGTKALAEDL